MTTNHYRSVTVNLRHFEGETITLLVNEDGSSIIRPEQTIIGRVYKLKELGGGVNSTKRAQVTINISQDGQQKGQQIPRARLVAAAWCGMDINDSSMHAHHIVPFKDGGSDHFSNLQALTAEAHVRLHANERRKAA